MRPRLILGLRGSEKLDPGVRMLAEQVARDEDADRQLVEPFQEERARESGLDLRRPGGVLRDRAPAFVPPQKRESIRSDPKKFVERAVMRQEDYVLERGKNALPVGFTGARGGDQEREIVDGNIGQRSFQHPNDPGAGRILEKGLFGRESG